MGSAPAFASVGEAMEVARAALGYLAAADAAALPAETQAQCLRGLERTDAVATAARASFLSAFTIGQGYSADADYSARAWLMHRTGITRGAAASHTAWANRARTHPKAAAAPAPAGKEDDRTREQRYHDALAEAMRRLVASGLLPERAGQPVKVWAHISLADLLRLDGDSALQEQWTEQVRARWAAHRAAASEGGGDGGAWLDGDAAGAIACDAAMAPIVTGDVNVGALEDLVRLCVELDGPRDRARDAAWAALEQAGIGKAVDLLSWPGRLASLLRRRQPGARLRGPSLPLDIGYAETIPAGIRNAGLLRHPHCQWA